tara:strand:- start:200 stop:973 length:774 start_codon:yes stop_codon:yes gene_type:complete
MLEMKLNEPEKRMGVKISINTLYYPGSNEKFIQAAKDVHKHFDININYHELQMRHGAWMDEVIKQSSADIVGFLDIDCIPLTKEAIPNILKFVAKNKSIAGCAQATNHIPPMSHIFIAPCCFFIWKPLWFALGSPSFMETQRSDVCEEICYVAEANGVRMKALYPTHFEKEPEEGAWRLHNYGLYGVGTVFDNQFYHLYQSRFKTNVDMFIDRAKRVVKNKFSTKHMHVSTNFDFDGRICNFDQEKNLRTQIEGKLL